MKLIDRIFKRGGPANAAPNDADHDDALVIVPIPPLVTLFMALEKQRGSPLTEDEVLEARDGAACITMTAEHRNQMAESRGFVDINPELAWSEWQIVREMLIRDGEL